MIKKLISRTIYPLFFFIFIIIESCVPGKKINFETLQPAHYYLPAIKDSVLVLNLSYYPWVDTSAFNIMKDLSRSEGYIIDTIINKALFNAFFNVLDNSELEFLKRNKYFEIRGESTDNFMENLDNESLKLLFTEFNTSLILSLEYIGFNYSAERVDFSENDIVRISTDRRLLWRIYEKDSGMIHEYIDMGDLFWEESGVSIRDAESKLPTLVDIIRGTFWIAGEKFGQQLSPYWKDEERDYYQLFNNWQDVSLKMEYLNDMAAKQKKIKSYKACFNLAVTYERLGQADSALIAINNALQLRPASYYANTYKQILEKVVKGRDSLDQQLIQDQQFWQDSGNIN